MTGMGMPIAHIRMADPAFPDSPFFASRFMGLAPILCYLRRAPRRTLEERRCRRDKGQGRRSKGLTVLEWLSRRVRKRAPGGLPRPPGTDDVVPWVPVSRSNRWTCEEWSVIARCFGPGANAKEWFSRPMKRGLDHGSARISLLTIAGDLHDSGPAKPKSPDREGALPSPPGPMIPCFWSCSRDLSYRRSPSARSSSLRWTTRRIRTRLSSTRKTAR